MPPTEYDILTRLPEDMAPSDLRKVLHELRKRLQQQQILAQTASAASTNKLGPILGTTK